MKKIIALGGSNSKSSINKKLAIYVAQQLKDTELLVLDMNDFDLPIYSIDHEKQHGIPKDATEFNNMLKSAHGIVMSLAEHNGSYAAAFKSAFDWLSRIDKKVWKDKPLFLMATSPGGRGGQSVLQAAKQSFPHLGGNIIADFSLPFFTKNFSEDRIMDDDKRLELNQKIKTFQEAIGLK